MNHNLTIERQDELGATHLIFKGIIDEEADFDSVFSDLKPTVMLDLEGIDLINSCGVREWIQAIQTLPKTSQIFYEKCAPRIVEQANYVANFLGTGKIVSFYAPYYCPKCKSEVNRLLMTKKLLNSHPVKAPSEKCPTCKGALEFDDSEEEYFSFLEMEH